MNGSALRNKPGIGWLFCCVVKLMHLSALHQATVVLMIYVWYEGLIQIYMKYRKHAIKLDGTLQKYFKSYKIFSILQKFNKNIDQSYISVIKFVI